MKRPAISLFALSCLLAAGAALAAGPGDRRERGVAGQVAEAAQDGEAAKSPLCVRETGTRLPRRACLPGRSYDREDLLRTGATDIGDALRRLDPAVSVHRF
ncbi:hypothetical protein [Rehaibacterium terrae]|jgi:hypothetical protein|uniref:Uncharacterized protein n=1 Tax=Rehaibacterium terrae TaxID=1341696 RepID=A0A7W7Y217_9GAMM|nr:hypothetical protein [Rehaibacterium terrae]MBB5016672.1 hypothetical protein [Rehaibacterium terrae]